MQSLGELLQTAAGRGATEMVLCTGQPVVFSTVRGEEPHGDEVSEDALFELLTGVLTNEQQVELAVGNLVEFSMDEAGHEWRLVTEPGSEGISIRAWRRNADGASGGISRGGGVELPHAVPHEITDDHSTPPPSGSSGSAFQAHDAVLGAVGDATNEESFDIDTEEEPAGEMPGVSMDPMPDPGFAVPPPEPPQEPPQEFGGGADPSALPPPPNPAASGAFEFDGLPLDDDDEATAAAASTTEDIHSPGGALDVGLEFPSGASSNPTPSESVSDSGFEFAPPPKPEPKRPAPRPAGVPSPMAMTHTPLPPPPPAQPGFGMPAGGAGFGGGTMPTRRDTPVAPPPSMPPPPAPPVAPAAPPAAAPPAAPPPAAPASSRAGTRDDLPPLEGPHGEELAALAADVPEGSVCFVPNEDLAVSLAEAFDGVPVVVRSASDLASMHVESSFVFLVEDPSEHLGWILRRLEEGAHVVVCCRARTGHGAQRTLLGVHATDAAREWLTAHPRFIVMPDGNQMGLATID